MEKILSGKPVANAILESIRAKLSGLNFTPTMALVMVGTDSASAYYVKNIVKQGAKLGMRIDHAELPETITHIDFISYISKLNSNPEIHGVMIQKPLPENIIEAEIDECINPLKDIDGIHPLNMGKLFLNRDCFVPCTASATIELIKHYKIETSGKHVVIVGRSAVVAKPLAGLLLKKEMFGNATVTICHSYTKDLAAITKSADILIAAIGKPRYINSLMLKDQAICLDVGINLIHDEKVGDIYVGDFDYEDCFTKSSAITPVPGGIGSITTSILLQNLLHAAIFNNSQEKKLT